MGIVNEILEGRDIRTVVELNAPREYSAQIRGESVQSFKTRQDLIDFLDANDLPIYLADFYGAEEHDGVYRNAYQDWVVLCYPEITQEAKQFKGSGKRINYEDDLVVVYDKDGNVVYKGMEDYDGMKDEPWVFDASIGAYRFKDFIKNCLA